ncbi:MAG: matrixin family metalloprotease [Sandaracinaceae bacterium]|nr:matrixin family metalloprotease [Sandaracinaceae bacterium]
MKRAVALACAAVLLGAAADAAAWCRMTTSRRQPTATEPCVLPDPSTDPPEQFLEWRRPCNSVGLSVAAPSRDLSELEVAGVLSRSAATWNAVSCDGVPVSYELRVLGERTTCTGPHYRDDGGNVNSVQFVLDWAERMYDANAFAVTTVWHRRSTGEIVDADLDLNERRGPFGICPDVGCDTRTVDLENVITHELGHMLGLAHSTDVDATMFVSAVAGETHKRDLHADDVAGICAVYPPGRPEGDCDPTPIGGLDLDCSAGCCTVAPGRPSRAGWPLGLALALIGARARLRARAARRRS